MVTAEDFNQVENKKISYDELLQQIKKEHQAKAKEFIPQLCYALQNEDPFLSDEDIRDRIKKDLIDIWSKTTIQNNIPDEFKDEAKQAAKEKADQKRKNVVEECVTVSSQTVPEQSSSGNTAIFESNHEHDPLQVADHVLKEKDYEIHRLRQELEQQKQKHEIETIPTTDTIPYNHQIDQEKEDLKKAVRELRQLLQHRFITFHSKKFENELRTCIMSVGYYKIYFNERMEMTKIES
ncbi:MAG TPA: hypothetical protein VH500_12400 [Nitrososphaeraceae archaeon]